MARGVALCLVLVVAACLGSVSHGSEVRRHGGHVVLIDARTGAVDTSFPDADDVVLSSATDGRGGWFIAGGFRHVGRVARPGVAHLRPDGQLDRRFAPGANGPLGIIIRNGGAVVALARHGDRVYVMDYRAVYALNALSGKQLWVTRTYSPNPSAGGTLAFGNGVLYVVGNFVRIGSTRRTDVAALDADTGAVLRWSIQVAPHTVGVVTPASGLVYVGGGFGLLGGKLRQHLGAVSAHSGKPTRWAPYSEGGYVEAIAIVGNVVLAGGDGFVAVNRRTGRPLAWRAALRGSATCFAVSGKTAFLGGTIHRGFTTAEGRAANNLAAVRLPSGRFTSWTPRVEHEMNVFTLTAAGHTVLAGGSFTHTLGGGP